MAWWDYFFNGRLTSIDWCRYAIDLAFEWRVALDGIGRLVVVAAVRLLGCEDAHFAGAFWSLAIVLGLDMRVESRIREIGFAAATDIIPAFLVLPGASTIFFFLLIEFILLHGFLY